MTIAQVILPIPLPKTYSYIIPRGMFIQVGSRVIVQFGSKKIYTGLVSEMKEAPAPDKAREIIEVLDDYPIVDQIQIKFFNWMAKYYMCTIGEVMNAAIPVGLKLSSESMISLNPENQWMDEPRSDRENILIIHLRDREMSIKEVGDLIGLKHPQKIVKALADRKIINLYEKVKDKYVPRYVRKVRIVEDMSDAQSLEVLLAKLDKKPKQQDVLLTYLKEVPILDNSFSNIKGIAKNKLAIDTSMSSINTLIKNGVLEEWDDIVSRLPPIDEIEFEIPQLSDIQTLAKNQILSEFDNKKSVLLRGITGSGKTEIYISMIRKILEKGKQVLYLLPEIALTTQIIQRLQCVFGNNFGVYHSQYSDNERVEVWQKVLTREYQFVVGVRSSVFLPFSNLGLVIIDEEHEPSYKQYDTSPRYHARDVAIFLANLHGAKTLMGTATPSVDTFYKALEGKFGLVELDVRYGDVPLPTVELIDMRGVRKRKELKANLFAADLLKKISQTLNEGDQIILFQNRRGFTPFVSCDDCGHVLGCPNCDVSLTYHQFQNQLICHYCGYKIYMLGECPDCGLNHMKHSGFGTEQLEDELHPFFPEAKIQRMDLDTTRNKNSYDRILSAFERGDTDILIGTQMISKGLDFDRVNLVGIFDIDRIIHFPDFRSHERAYQLITQVSGRSGRKSGKGRVLIQTNDPNHEVLKKVLKEDYRSFYHSEITEREQFQYPPFYRLIRIILKHKEVQIVNEASIYLGNLIRQHLGKERVNGPVDPVINRLRNLYLKEIFIRLELTNISHSEVKNLLINFREDMNSQKGFKGVSVIFDVDPV